MFRTLIQFAKRRPRGRALADAGNSQVAVPQTRFLPDAGDPFGYVMTDSALVLDVSPSMAETDYPPSRLGAAIEAAIEFATARRVFDSRGRIGVCGFSCIAVPVCPLTACSELDKLLTSIRSVKRVSSGTNITAGLSLAESLFNDSPRHGAMKELVLLSDGAHNVGPDPLVIADRLKVGGCILRTVGIGGSPEAVDEATLKKIASTDARGRPFYRFIADRDGLVRHFGQLGGGLTR